MPISFMTKSFEKIIEDKDIKAGLEYLLQRASTIRELQIIAMISRMLVAEVEMRNSLIELLQDNGYLDVLNDEHWLLAAEQLIAGGVIVLPPLGKERKMSIKLKPCPFCGGEAELRYFPYMSFLSQSTRSYYVECTQCGIRFMPRFDSKISVNRAWNRRADK